MARHSDGDSNPYGLNEVDEFAEKSERILLENSTLNRRHDDDDDDDMLDDDEEEEIMSMSGEDSEEGEEEEELDGERAYKKVFGRNLAEDQRPYEDGEDEEGGMLDNEAAWGSNKNEYYGADDLDDDETAKEIEKEALRQQKKHLEELNMQDYLDDEVEEEWVKDAKEFDVAEFQNSTKQKDSSSVSIKDVLNMDDESRKDFFKTMFPEFSPLCKEFTKLNDNLVELSGQKKTEFSKIKIMALSTYLGTIASYLGVLLHEMKTNEDFTTMKDHPVMEAILTSKEVWRQASELPNDFDPAQEDYEEQQSEIESDSNDIQNVRELDSNVLENIENGDENLDDEVVVAEDDDEDEDEEDEADLDDFEEYIAQSRISKKDTISKKSSPDDIDDFVESEMADVDAQEKKARKKALRFYTSKIDQQENKKSNRFAGDDDIPYKERLYERQQRLLEEARKRGLHDSNGADLDNKDYDSQDEAISKDVNTKSTVDYYEQVQKGRQQRKEARQNAHKTAVIAAREGKLAEAIEELGEGGKRAINYQILKNKGLTPKRKKDNRNSRVKKRKKYEKAQKKLKSVRAVYSGGQSGVYEGEKTGIKKNLTRSVKFRN